MIEGSFDEWSPHAVHRLLVGARLWLGCGRHQPQRVIRLIGGLVFVVAFFDLVIIDWLIICACRPRRLVLSGTEDCAGWGGYLFHVKEQPAPRGIALLIGSGSVIGLLALWIS